MMPRAPSSRDRDISESRFRLRGTEMIRLEAVNDVVFGFALTLLVVSLEVPHTYADLVNAMRGFPAFALTFAMLMSVWAQHYQFFRRYGLSDSATILLNTLLLFVVLFYVYPLKFLFYVWLSPLTGTAMEVRGANGVLRPMMGHADARGLMLIFSSGFSAVYLVFASLYWHAYRMRGVLKLDLYEVTQTTTDIVEQILLVIVALVSIVVALILPPDRAGNAGYTFLLVPLLLNVNQWLWKRRQRNLGP